MRAEQFMRTKDFLKIKCLALDPVKQDDYM